MLSVCGKLYVLKKSKSPNDVIGGSMMQAHFCILFNQKKTTMINKPTFKAALLAAASMAIFSLSSCQKETPDNPGSGNNAPRLVSYQSGEEKMSFTYNADQSLRTVTVKNDLVTGGEENVYTLSYRPDKKIAAFTASGGNRIQLLWNNQVLTGIETWVANQKVSVTDYEYQNGSLKTVSVYLVNGNNRVALMKFSFVYNTAGNVGRLNTWTYNFPNGQLEYSGHADMEYDSNPNPFTGLKEVLQVFWQVATPNNVKKITQFDTAGVQEEETVYTYTYNDRRLPVSATIRSTGTGLPPLNSTAQFTYRL
jgi:hypothetical protein